MHLLKSNYRYSFFIYLFLHVVRYSTETSGGRHALDGREFRDRSALLRGRKEVSGTRPERWLEDKGGEFVPGQDTFWLSVS